MVKDFNRKIYAARDAAQTSGQDIKAKAAFMELQVQAGCKAFEGLLMHTASQTTSRNGQPIDIESFQEQLDRIAQRLKEWRVVGMKGAFIFIKKTHLEEQLRKLVTKYFL